MGVIRNIKNEYSMVSPIDDRIYYFTEEAYQQCQYMINRANAVLHEDEYYVFIDMCMKIYAYDSVSDT